MPKDDENNIWFEVLQRLTKIETNTEWLYLQVQHHISQKTHYLNILYGKYWLLLSIEFQ